MSTKIYNGISFAITDIVSLIDRLRDFRTEVEALGDAALHEVAARKMVGEIDGALVDGRKFEKDFHDIIDDIDQRQKKSRTEGTRDPVVDHDFDLVLMPFEARWYGMLYAEQSEYYSLICNQHYAEEYSFWNNTDPPEGLNAEIWAERERVWEGILSRDPLSRPGRCGMSFMLERGYFFPNIVDVLPFVPTRSERARAQAERILCDNLFKEALRADIDAATKPQTHAINALRGVRDPRNADRLAEMQSNIIEMLPDITRQWAIDNFM